MKKVAGLSTSSPRLARVLALALMSVTAVACGGGGGGGDDGDDDDGPPPYDGPVLKRASKSSTIAITGDDKFVVMVNPEDDSIAIFDTATDKRTALVTVGDEPSSVVIGPDDDTAYVSNRGDATVVKVTGIKGATPTVGEPLDVGSEPTGLALAPTGRVLFVAEFAEGRIGVIDTATMTLKDKIEAPKNPKAIAVTNDGDQEDADETLVVPEFFGEANGAPEGSDTGRTGKVRLYDVEGLEAQSPITLAPRPTGFKAEVLGAPVGDEVTASPNQLSSVIVIGSKIYVTSVSASPQGPTFFKTNVQPVVYVGDLGQRKEDTSPLGTMNLAKLIEDQIPADQTRFFMADLIDVTFVKTDVMYALSKGGDAIQRIVLDPAKGPTLGSDFNKQIDLGVLAAGGTKKQCQTPTGMVIAHASARAFVNCWITRQIGFVDLSKQVLAKTEEAASIKSAEVPVQEGRRFYFTARGRWSQAAWSSCGSCHPDGLSDNITWHFGTGPRQTTSMDGSYSHAANAPQQQRVLNWTGIFDEIHDFERNTRGVSGGKGAITTPGASGQCGGANLAAEVQVKIGIDGLRTSPERGPRPDDDPNVPIPTAPSSVKELQDKTAGVCTKDWDKIDAFVKTIRPPRALRFIDPASVARGAAIFAVPGTPGADQNAAGCAGCHSGPGWTLSRAFYKSTTARVDQLAAVAFAPAPEFNKNAEKAWNFHAFQVEKQPGSSLFAGPEAAAAGIAPNQVSCAIRNVGTFGVLGDDDATLELEKRDNGARAQGRLGYNIPALYGLALGAPYLHHGQAATLEDLFNNQKFLQHAEAGSAVWLRQGADTLEQRKKDLINFLLSIDATTKTVAIPAGYDACPANDK